MLLSLYIELANPRPARIPAEQGAAIYAWALRLIDAADPALARAIHDHDGPKPLTASTLLGTGRRERGMVRLAPGRAYGLRITALDAPTARALLAGLYGEKPPPLTLGGAPVTIERATYDAADHRWAGSVGADELYQAYGLTAARPPNTIAMRFHSPTLFRIDGQDQPLCHPGWVFGSYIRRWNAFGRTPMPGDLGDYVQQGVTLGRFELSSAYVPVEHGKKGGHVGFHGAATFRLRIHDPFYMRLVHLLSAHSFWCGTGYRTTMGLGQTSLDGKSRWSP